MAVARSTTDAASVVEGGGKRRLKGRGGRGRLLIVLGHASRLGRG